MRNRHLVFGSLLATFSVATSAYAGEPAEAGGEVSLSAGGDGVEGSADGSANADGPTEAEKEAWKRKDVPWIKRWVPEKGMGEIGIYGGVFFASKNHELFGPDIDLPDQGWKPYKLANPDIGLRAGYYPIKWVGVEVEGGVIPLALEDGSGTAMGYTVRGHVVGQLAMWSIVPFAVLGAGALGVSSDQSLVGDDVDPSLHFGVGAKVYLNRYTMLRLDVRDNVTYQQGVDANFRDLGNVELLLGLSVTLGREKAEVAEPEPEPEPEPAPSDRDGDGFLDELDACPDEPGVEPDGCPIKDSDGDGILDPDDKCPDEPGVEEYQGCPIPDTDGDGILDPDDKCVEEPETKNGYEDADGCPDEVPEEVKKFTGVIEGIYFDTNKDTIKPNSERILNRALKVLKDYPDIRLGISGHTDSRGKYDHNMDLSRRRAESVKNWFVGKGIDSSRFTTEGFGPDQPVDTNDTSAGRAKNRRIEFKLLSQ